MYELKRGTARIVCVLEQYKDDSVAISLIAHALHYNPEQLIQDIQALSDYYNATNINEVNSYEH